METKAEKSAVTAVENALGNKANSADVSALSQSVAALSSAVSGKGNCKIATGTYVGTGTYGSANPMSLTFDFVPQVVWFVTEASCSYSTGVFIRPTVASRGLDGKNLILSWGEKGVSWYCGINDGSNHADSQNNLLGTTYYWIAIGM